MSDDQRVGMGLVLDCTDPVRLAEFWAPALDYVSAGEFGAYVALFPNGRPGPKLLLQRLAEPKAGKNRMHLDIEVPDIEAEAAARRARRDPGPAGDPQRAGHDLGPHDRPRRQRVLRLRRRPAPHLTSASAPAAGTCYTER